MEASRTTVRKSQFFGFTVQDCCLEHDCDLGGSGTRTGESGKAHRMGGRKGASYQPSQVPQVPQWPGGVDTGHEEPRSGPPRNGCHGWAGSGRF